MKYDKYPVTTDKYGFEFAKNDVMVSKYESRCMMCGSPTKYIDVISEGYFCSDECLDKFYQELSEAIWMKG